MIEVEPYGDEIMQRARAIQEVIMLPREFDSPYFVARMLRARDDEKEVKRLIDELLVHRRLLGYDKADELAVYRKIFPQVYSRFSTSYITGSPRSGNVHVFIQKMKDVHLREILSTIPCSHIIHAYFALQEIFGRQIVATEKETGKQLLPNSLFCGHSPSAIVTILDLTGLNLSEFLNPLSVNCKLAKYIVSVWGEYFSETLDRILIINPPAIVSIMWQVTKHIMDARTVNRISFLSNVEQLKEHLDPKAIPVEYGGEWRDDSGFSQPPEGCVTRPLPVLPAHTADPLDIWKKHGIIKPPSPSSYTIKSKKTVDIPCSASQDGYLIYSFTTSGEISFGIFKRENGKDTVVWPVIRLASLTIPEQGAHLVEKGEYLLRFTNPFNSWISPKVQCSVQFVPS